ncbi:MarR family winged helix-turn-helix transcriptional regulator [Paracoccus xiamenensis]|uniref:MarR family winged helix-turn-helix transcriptional regulator n=1 Tax=Paracoccus xiamenensis TaxID=2714901 RepID=UPI00140A1485|nr:MarR family transcriptional regulator [Paracoccus xiamenensis]NHF72857.1 MarR family transcriptional regulator [Paracoccus xiamenensis]
MSNDLSTDIHSRSALGSEDDPLAMRRLKLWIRMLGVTRQVENQLREFLRVSHDTTLPRFDVMAALHRWRDGLTMTELSRTLLISNGNATTVVNRLVKDGLVARIHSEEDRRRITVRLTPKGLETFEAVAAEHRDMVNDLFGDMTEADLDAMRGVLRRLRDGLSTQNVSLPME